MFTNVFYFYMINDIGGIETFYYNLAKKYRDRDITIFYQVGAAAQIRRLQKYVRVIQYRGEIIECKRAFFNFNLDIIDNIKAEEYIQIIHGDYKSMKIMPNRSPRIDRYLACSKLAADTFKELTGIECQVIYNPVDDEIPSTDRALRLVSATRLTSEKGKDRMLKMAQLLDAADVNYTWIVFTDDKTRPINNPNIIYRKPEINIAPHIASADWLVQLSDNEGYCYSVVEALQLGVPVIVTPCPVFDEIGVNESNSIKIPFVFEEIPVDEILKRKPAFTYKPKKDAWASMLGRNKSTYALNNDATIVCKTLYMDLQLNRYVQRGEEMTVGRDRAEQLADLGLVDIVG